MKSVLAAGAALITLMAIAAAPAQAGVWVLSNDNGGDGHLGTPDPGYQYQIIGADNGVGPNTTTFVNTAASAETLNFKWSYTTHDCCGSYWDPGGYVVNGVKTQLAGSPSSGTDVGATYTGSLSLNLNAGDSYGFYVYSLDSVAGPGVIEFSAGVPEPGTWALMILGVAMIGYAARRRSSGAILPGIVV